jgi:SAM-dependent methyltransferase
LKRPGVVYQDYGVRHGTPVDRLYIRRFVAEHSRAIRGRVLEVDRAEWVLLAEAETVSDLDILDVDAHNPRANIFGDLGDPHLLKRQTYDCILMMQTLQYVAEPRAVISHLWKALAPGGTLLLSVPVLTRLDLMCGPEGDKWRMTVSGLRSVLEDHAPDGRIDVRGYGSLASAVGFLAGVPSEKLGRRVMGWDDPIFALVVCARVDKRA